MKKFTSVILAVVVAGFVAQPAFAAKAAKHAAAATNKGEWSRPYGMAGCGLGSAVVGKRGGQIFAATTNGTFWNQTFAITAGTLNCVDGPNNEVAKRMDTFVAANKVAVAGDIARGSGETLANLSVMAGCDASSAQFGSAMQQNFRSIFPSTDVAPNEITDSIITVIRNDADLSAVCKQIS